jgi:hypothetical protein
MTTSPTLWSNDPGNDPGIILKQFFSVNDFDLICSSIIKHDSASALVESCLDRRAYEVQFVSVNLNINLATYNI